jgi:hypothetical protein
MKPWTTPNGWQLDIGHNRPQRSRWGTIAQSQALPAQPAAWGDTWPRVALGCALFVAAVAAWMVAS